MKPIKLFIFLFLFGIKTMVFSQDHVTVVLSGGGATALAHIGVLKTLEENNIPIHSIGGTSMGAIIGALYATGIDIYTMEQWAKNGFFREISSGEKGLGANYLFKQEAANSGILSLKFDPLKPLNKNLPTNLNSSAALDFELMQCFAIPSIVANNDFNNFMIPFFTVASDISKQSVTVFRKGYLPGALRATTAFPFYFSPHAINGITYFDGGIYDNFPLEEAEKAFLPTLIIGSDVSDLDHQVSTDDLVSQVRGLIVHRREIKTKGTPVVIISPKSEVGTFDFENAPSAIINGTIETMKHIAEIKSHISSASSPDSLFQQRQTYRNALPEFKAQLKQRKKKSPNSKKKSIKSLDILETRTLFSRAVQNPLLDNVFPEIRQENDSATNQILQFRTSTAPPLEFQAGGVFSTSPISTGFFQLKYKRLKKIGTIISANSYFGKFYSSFGFKGEWWFNSRHDYKIEAGAYYNNFDFFKAKATFFNQDIPSFIVLKNQLAFINFITPLSQSSTLSLENKYMDISANYYENKEFSAIDIPDQTNFFGYSTGLNYTYNTLNRKQFESKGSYLRFKVSLNQGTGSSVPGTTSINPISLSHSREWTKANLKGQHFFSLGKGSIGLLTEANYNNQPEFSSITGTLIFSDNFSPVPESQTQFLEEFRANYFVGSGLKLIHPIYEKLEVHAYGFQFTNLARFSLDKELRAESELGKLESDFMLSSGLFFESPFGPISLFYNHFGKNAGGFISLNFGFILFNPRCLE